MPSLPQFQVLDVVALKHDLPEHNLTAGQVGTLVEHLAPNVYEVDFSDDDGQTYAMLPLHTSQFATSSRPLTAAPCDEQHRFSMFPTPPWLNSPSPCSGRHLRTRP